MANSRLGLAEQAQKHFAEAERLTKIIQWACWVDSLQLKLLTDETRAVISGSRVTVLDGGTNGG